ncbi:MAG: twin-arginine translocation signal domain-containing protein [bacterium]|nr:twin-arginine translocation signal domain-containing protein [bacterium]
MESPKSKKGPENPVRRSVLKGLAASALGAVGITALNAQAETGAEIRQRELDRIAFNARSLEQDFPFDPDIAEIEKNTLSELNAEGISQGKDDSLKLEPYETRYSERKTKIFAPVAGAMLGAAAGAEIARRKNAESKDTEPISLGRRGFLGGVAGAVAGGVLSAGINAKQPDEFQQDIAIANLGKWLRAERGKGGLKTKAEVEKAIADRYNWLTNEQKKFKSKSEAK